MPTSSGCFKSYRSHLENALEIENVGILQEEVISHAFGWSFSLFFFFFLSFQIQALNTQVSENQ